MILSARAGDEAVQKAIVDTTGKRFRPHVTPIIYTTRPQDIVAREATPATDAASSVTIADVPSQCMSDNVLALSLKNSVLKDGKHRTGYIAANRQFQFDGPAQTGAIYTAGFSVCKTGLLALGTSTQWWACNSGDFANLYDTNWAPQCRPITFKVIKLIDCPAHTNDTSSNSVMQMVERSAADLAKRDPSTSDSSKLSTLGSSAISKASSVSALGHPATGAGGGNSTDTDKDDKDDDGDDLNDEDDQESESSSSILETESEDMNFSVLLMLAEGTFSPTSEQILESRRHHQKHHKHHKNRKQAEKEYSVDRFFASWRAVCPMSQKDAADIKHAWNMTLLMVGSEIYNPVSVMPRGSMATGVILKHWEQMAKYFDSFAVSKTCVKAIVDQDSKFWNTWHRFGRK